MLTGGAVRPVRLLLDPDQLDQFDRSMTTPADDGRHAATGWLVRFDPAKVALADPQVRVQGTLRVAEAGPDALEVTSDHTFVYALRPAGASGPRADDASLFTVRRELHFRFDREDLRQHRAELLVSYVQAGPQACSADASGALRPLLAGQRATADGPAGTDPYATGRPPRRSAARCRPALSLALTAPPSRCRGVRPAVQSARTAAGRRCPPVRRRPRRCRRRCRRRRCRRAPVNLSRSLPPRSPAPPAMSPTSFISGSLLVRTVSA